MARIVDFTGGQPKKALGGDLQQSLILKQILEQGRNKEPILSNASLGLNLGKEAINAFTVGKLLGDQQDSETARAKTIQDAFFGEDAGHPGPDLNVPQAPTASPEPNIAEGDVVQRAGQIMQAGEAGNPQEASNIARQIEIENAQFKPGGPGGGLPSQAPVSVQGNVPLPQPAPAPQGRRPFDLEKAAKTLLGNPQTQDLGLQLMGQLLQGKNESALFTKPNIKDFTPESIGNFQGSRNPGDLRRRAPKPDSKVTSALIPLILGGIDFSNPEELAKGLQTIQGASNALSNPGDQRKLNGVLEAIQKGQSKLQEPTPEDPGFLSQGVDFAKEKAGQMKDFIIEKFKDGSIPDVSTITEFFDSFTQGDGKGSVSVDDQEVFDFNSGASIDEDGFFFIPDQNAKNGKRFIFDKDPTEGGKKLKSSRFK